MDDLTTRRSGPFRARIQARLERRLEDGCREIGPEELARSAIVVAPHFDDETLGCGGTIVRKIRAGASVHVVFLTDGTASHGDHMVKDQLAELRRQEALAAAAELGLSRSSVSFGDLPDGELEQYHPEAVALLSSLLETHRPLQVYAPHLGDGHADHRAATRAALEAVAPTATVADVYEYPVWHWQQWPWVRLPSPLRRRHWGPGELHGDAWRRSAAGRFGLAFAASLNGFVDVSGVLDQKRAALCCYDSQVNRVDGTSDWATLNDVSSGDFLRRLLSDRELFRVRSGAERGSPR